MRARLVQVKASRLLALATVLALLVAAMTTFVASGQEPAVTYYACLKNGNLSDVGTSAPDKCPGKGTVISWNNQGLPSATGATGPVGAPGATGAQGAAGAPGAAGVSGYEIVTASTASSVGATTQAMTATCPVGKQAVGGGGQSVFVIGISGYFELITLHASRPISNGSGWNVQAADPNLGQHTGWYLTAYAVCANVGP